MGYLMNNNRIFNKYPAWIPVLAILVLGGIVGTVISGIKYKMNVGWASAREAFAERLKHETQLHQFFHHLKSLRRVAYKLHYSNIQQIAICCT
ncbi:MAG UNVERIFIED_CONTAM: hypothetical protein LVR29_22650, partial [Microcystis novacekii LVE1205-3]